jgi:glycosyltransferase involved in cell wall biosynthesis
MFLAIWMGILEPFRRIEDLLQAVYILFQKGIPAYCLIAGRTQDAHMYVNRLKRLVVALGLQSQVRFVEDTIPEERLADYYSACDVFVFPNDQQSWGLAPLEALSCRRPVIVSRGSGVHEVLRDGDTALLVPPRDPEALANAIARIANDRVLAQRIADRGREFVARDLTWDNFANSMADLMERAVFKTLRRGTKRIAARRPAADLVQGVISATEPLWRIR